MTLGPASTLLIAGALRVYRGPRRNPRLTEAEIDDVNRRVWSKLARGGVDYVGYKNINELLGHLGDILPVIGQARSLLPMAIVPEDFEVIESALFNAGICVPGTEPSPTSLGSAARRWNIEPLRDEWRVVAAHALRRIVATCEEVPSDYLPEKTLMYALGLLVCEPNVDAPTLAPAVEFALADELLGWVKRQPMGLAHYTAIVETLADIHALPSYRS